MKVYCKYLFAALATTVTLAGCVQEITPPNFENDKVNSEGSRVIAVSFASQTKTTLDGFQPKFANKDSILISNGEALDTCEVKVDDKEATITTNLTGPLTAVYPYKAAKMNDSKTTQIDTVLVSTEQSGKFADANICMAKMKDEKDESLSFENKTAVFCIKPPTNSPGYVEVSAEGFDIANYIPTGSTNTDSSAIHVAPVTTDSVYVSILVPDGLTIGDLKFSDGTNEKIITGDKAATEIAAGTLYTVDNENWESPEVNIPEGAVKGVFTVGAGPDGEAGTADDVKVYFSQGNLVATIDASGNPIAWKFAAHQYDYLGEGGANKTIGKDGGDIDFFGWSTDATSNNWGIHTETTATEGFTTGSFKDWGEKIEVGNTWRTLSKDEWCYLFAYNPETSQFIEESPRSNLHKTKVNVCGKSNCIVLLPDDWEWNKNGVGDTWQIEGYDIQYSEETKIKWSTMEAAGAVCLPAAGRRYGSNVSNVGDFVFYWSSTDKDGSNAYTVDVINDHVRPYYYYDRFRGYSVRLVTDVSATPAPTPADVDYIEIKAKYNGTDSTILKWSRQNLAITDSGKKSWEGGNTSGAVKVPGTDSDVVVGDYFQWAANEGYCGDASNTDKGLLIYTDFTSTGCGDSEDKFTFKSAGESITYRFNTASTDTSVGISPYYSDSAYDKYTKTSSSEGDGKNVLVKNDDVASIILGGTWRMPTADEFKAMKDATYWAWDDNDKGYYVFAPNANHKAGNRDGSLPSDLSKSAALLFFPATGRGNGDLLSGAGTLGRYWSSDLYSENVKAYGLNFGQNTVSPQSYSERYYGWPVRPVSE